MKKVFPILYFLFLTQIAFSQIPSSCVLPPTLQTAYSLDVKHLALWRILSLSTPDTGSIIIPQTYQDTIWEGLAAIFNITSVPERDSVFDIYCVHTDPWISLLKHSVSVQIDTTNIWTQQWQNQQTLTGYSILDTLLVKYGFTVTDYHSYTYQIATLYTNQELNIYAFADSLEKLSGIIKASPEPSIDGTYIYYTKPDSNRYYYFDLGLGDCPSGCTGRHDWEFKVLPDCSVNFSGTFVSGLPEPMPPTVNCNLSSSIRQGEMIFNFAEIFPNPNCGKFSLQTTFTSQTQNINVEIYNVIGEIIYQAQTISPKAEIDISSHPKGIYFVRAIVGGMTHQKKIIID